MQAIILAAGKGSRMGEITKNIPKPMVPLAGVPLIKINIKNLSLAGIQSVIVAIGYRGEELKALLGNSCYGVNISYVHNDNFETTNNIYTLWECRSYLCADDTIIVEGDLLYDPIIIKKMTRSDANNLIGVTPFKSWMNGTVIKRNANGRFSKGQSSLKTSSISYLKTINIYKFSKEFSHSILLPLLKKKIDRNELNLYYEDVISSTTLNKHFSIYKIDETEKWIEIDNPLDLVHASVKFTKTKEQYNTVLSSFGGLWRLPEVLDFFYLTNPFFPNTELLTELKNVLDDLILNYPSGRSLVGSLASVAFNCSVDTVIVSNGASEIIECLLNSLKCTFGVFVPTFDEYINRINADDLRIYEAAPPQFNIHLEDLIEISKVSKCIILVNPNNPTGSVISKDILLEFLEHIKQQNKFLIVDESFADFCNEDVSLIDQQILNRFDNLFVIKSLGKSYGIPGLRLGALFTSNKSVRNVIKTFLPIWNINSIAEYFLEIFPRHKNRFIRACEETMIERSLFSEMLSEIKNLKVIKSHANFILCELLGGHKADDLAFRLFSEFNILIKDCSKKKGFKGMQYIRIAVKRRDQNLLLIKGLKKIL